MKHPVLLGNRVVAPRVAHKGEHWKARMVISSMALACGLACTGRGILTGEFHSSQPL